jgi:hypothetical protein
MTLIGHSFSCSSPLRFEGGNAECLAGFIVAVRSSFLTLTIFYCFSDWLFSSSHHHAQSHMAGSLNIIKLGFL